MTEPARADPRLWPLVYLPTVVGLGMVLIMLWRAARPYRPRRTRQKEASA